MVSDNEVKCVWSFQVLWKKLHLNPGKTILWWFQTPLILNLICEVDQITQEFCFKFRCSSGFYIYHSLTLSIVLIEVITKWQYRLLCITKYALFLIQWTQDLETYVALHCEMYIYIAPNTSIYEGKTISKLQMDIELKQIRVLIWKILLFLNIISLYIEARVP
jgi:hypothetical protein